MTNTSASRRAAALPSKIALLVCVLCGLLAAGDVHAARREPLLMLGKASLYQRVLTRPSAPLFGTAGDSNPRDTFTPFEIFYVYARKDVGGKAFIEVGRSLENGPEGWMPEDKSIEWKQAIVLGFNNPADRERALIFKTKDGLQDVLSQEDVSARLGQLRRDAVNGIGSAESPIVSVEPSEPVDIEKEFYVLPIVEAERIRLPTRLSAKLLKIASVPERAGPAAGGEVSREDALKNFRIGVTFVIDSTRSMQPYIDEVREAVKRLRDRIAGSPQADRFRFGLVAFRDNVSEVRDLDYVSKVFLPLDEASTADKFLTAIGQVQAARASSVGFDEDSIAGVHMAAKQMNWQPFGGRFVILITDAGPRTPGPGAAQGALAPAELQTLLETQNGIALFTLHLKTEAGRFDHQSAEEAYRRMSKFNGAGLYYPIEGGGREPFGRQVDMLADELSKMVQSAVEGRIREASAEGAGSVGDTVGQIGRAMQLAYLGAASSTRAPDVFEGWITDRDPIDRNVFPVTPYLLMSKNELSTLRDVIKRAVELGTSAIQEGRSDDFFNRLREAVALMSVRPAAVQNAGTLGGLLGEYLEALPYNSEIINITAQDWRDMSPIRERQLLDTLRSKVTALERIHSDTRRWHAIKPDAPAGEYVTVVPLSLMP